jgi:hypothetical protein
VELPQGFGPCPSLSLFLYNEDGRQAIARLHLESPPPLVRLGPSPPADHSAMPKYHEIDRWDDGSNAPSSNFIYDFEVLRWFVRDDWTEALHHDSDGSVLAGSVDTLADAFARGAEIKASLGDLCADLTFPGAIRPAHEVFIQTGSCYYYTCKKLFIAGSHPLVRVAPAIPLVYRTHGWDYSWLVLRSDGRVARLSYDPYTLKTTRATGHHAIRWFFR